MQDSTLAVNNLDEIGRDLIFHLDPVSFCEHLGFNLDPWQKKVMTTTSRRLCLNCSRQSGKSTITALLSLHRALFKPNTLILLLSPSLRQSSELFRKVSDLLRKLEPRPKLLEDNRLSCTFENQSRVISLPSSEATVRGYSNVDLIVEDESSRVPDDLYKSVRPMLATSNGQLILMSTPFGKRGHFYETWEDGENWERTLLPAEECPRISKEFLEEERRTLGDWYYQQEYGCEFVEEESQLFGYDLISAAISDDVKPLFPNQAIEVLIDDSEASE